MLMGLGVFYRIPQVMSRISSYEESSIQIMFIRFCFYLVGVMLLGGGVGSFIIFLKKTLMKI